MMNAIDTTKKRRRKNGMVSLRPLKRKILLAALLVIIASISIITYICTSRSRPGYGGEQLISSSPSRYVGSKSSEISNQRRLAEGDQQLSDVCLNSAESEQETEENEKRAKKEVQLHINRLSVIKYDHRNDVARFLEILNSRVQSRMGEGGKKELRKSILKQMKRLISWENNTLQHMEALVNAREVFVRIKVNRGKSSVYEKRMLEECRSSKKRQVDRVRKLEELERKEKEDSQDAQRMLQEWEHVLISVEELPEEEKVSEEEWSRMRHIINKSISEMQPRGFWRYKGRRLHHPGRSNFDAAAKREIKTWPEVFDETVIEAVSGKIENFPERGNWGSQSEKENKKWRTKMRDVVTRMSYKEIKLTAGHIVRSHGRNNEKAAREFLLKIQDEEEIKKVETLVNKRIAIRTSKKTPYEMNAAQIEGGNTADENIKAELRRPLYKKAKEAVSFFRIEYPEFVNSRKVMIEIEKIQQITRVDILEDSEDAEAVGGSDTELSELEIDPTKVEGEGAFKKKKQQVGSKKAGTQKGEYGRAIVYISSDEDENE